jgi:hypothetical protein
MSKRYGVENLAACESMSMAIGFTAKLSHLPGFQATVYLGPRGSQPRPRRGRQQHQPQPPHTLCREDAAHEQANVIIQQPHKPARICAADAHLAQSLQGADLHLPHDIGQCMGIAVGLLA